MSENVDSLKSSTSPAPRAPAVFTVPPYRSFLQSVASGLLEQTKHDPLKISDLTILVPDRDTAFRLKQAFMEQL